MSSRRMPTPRWFNVVLRASAGKREMGAWDRWARIPTWFDEGDDDLRAEGRVGGSGDASGG